MHLFHFIHEFIIFSRFLTRYFLHFLHSLHFLTRPIQFTNSMSDFSNLSPDHTELISELKSRLPREIFCQLQVFGDQNGWKIKWLGLQAGRCIGYVNNKWTVECFPTIKFSESIAEAVTLFVESAREITMLNYLH